MTDMYFCNANTSAQASSCLPPKYYQFLLKMRIFFLNYMLIVSLFLAAFPAFAQQNAASTAFPADWTGIWGGDLNIYTPKGLVQQVPMTLSILPLENGHYSWTIQYGPDSAGLRPYTLEPVDTSLGRWQVNENNGIILREQLLGGKIFSVFSVEGTLLVSTVELAGDELLYEIIAGPIKPAYQSPAPPVPDDMPTVDVYGIGTRQFARLRRQ